MGGWRLEIWKGRWGVFSDTVFIYISDSLSAGGAREIKVNPKQLLPTVVPIRLELSGHLKFWSRLLWQDVGGRFLVGTVPLKAGKPLPVMSCELLGGSRYAYFNQDVSLGVNSPSLGLEAPNF